MTSLIVAILSICIILATLIVYKTNTDSYQSGDAIDVIIGKR